MEACKQCSSTAKSIYHFAGSCPKPAHVGLVRMAESTRSTARLRTQVRGR